LPSARRISTVSIPTRRRIQINIQLRRCIAGDEERLSLIGQSTFLETFAGILGGSDILAHCAAAHSPEHYRKWLSMPDHRVWIAETSPGDAPIGFMAVAPAQLPLPDLSPRDMELKRIYILGRFHGGGLGKRFLQEAIQHARSCDAERLLLGVFAHNHAAIGFYERAGFRQLGARKFKVGGKDYDDTIMGLSLHVQQVVL